MPRIDVRFIRREQILDAMEPLVAEYGWEHTTFAEICKAAGVSNRVLTYHFRDKDDLLFAIFERALRRLRENFEPIRPEHVSIEEKLAFMFRGAPIEHERRQLMLLFVHLMAQATVRPDIAERMRQLFGAMRAHLVDGIRTANSEGRINDPDPDGTAAIFQCVMFGLMVSRAVLDIEPPADRMVAMMLGHLHTGTVCPATNGKYSQIASRGAHGGE